PDFATLSPGWPHSYSRHLVTPTACAVDAGTIGLDTADASSAEPIGEEFDIVPTRLITDDGRKIDFHADGSVYKASAGIRLSFTYSSTTGKITMLDEHQN